MLLPTPTNEVREGPGTGGLWRDNLVGYRCRQWRCRFGQDSGVGRELHTSTGFLLVLVSKIDTRPRTRATKSQKPKSGRLGPRHLAAATTLYIVRLKYVRCGPASTSLSHLQKRLVRPHPTRDNSFFNLTSEGKRLQRPIATQLATNAGTLSLFVLLPIRSYWVREACDFGQSRKDVLFDRSRRVVVGC